MVGYQSATFLTMKKLASLSLAFLLWQGSILLAEMAVAHYTVPLPLLTAGVLLAFFGAQLIAMNQGLRVLYMLWGLFTLAHGSKQWPGGVPYAAMVVLCLCSIVVGLGSGPATAFIRRRIDPPTGQ